MTGKDFSGPTPEIRPPAQLSLINQPKHTSQERLPAGTGADKSGVATVQDGGEEVLGEISSFDG